MFIVAFYDYAHSYIDDDTFPVIGNPNASLNDIQCAIFDGQANQNATRLTASQAFSEQTIDMYKRLFSGPKMFASDINQDLIDVRYCVQDAAERIAAISQNVGRIVLFHNDDDSLVGIIADKPWLQFTYTSEPEVRRYSGVARVDLLTIDGNTGKKQLKDSLPITANAAEYKSNPMEMHLVAYQGVHIAFGVHACLRAIRTNRLRSKSGITPASFAQQVAALTS